MVSRPIFYGGIYPITPPEGEDERGQAFRCFHCGRDTPILDHYYETARMHFHRKCIEPFLETPEGGKFNEKGLEVIMSENGSLRKVR